MGDNELPSKADEVANSTTTEAGPSRRSGGTEAFSSRKEQGKGSQQTRKRETLVCAECKRAKQRCNLEEPCERCIQKGYPDKCIYPEAPQNKSDEPSLEARVGNLEKFVGQLVEGVVPVPWPGGASSSNEEVERSKAEHIAAGRILRPNPSLFSSTRPPAPQDQGPASELDATMITHGPSALLSCVSDAAHGCLHLICQSEGLLNDIPYDRSCLRCTTGQTHDAVQEGSRGPIDVNATPSAVHKPARAAAPPLRPQVLDSVRFLPAPKIYYHSGARFYYTQQGEVHHAYPNDNAQLPTSFSSPPPSLSTSRPSLTQELMSCIPERSKYLEYLANAQVILTQTPVEIGQWSHTAAWPEELRHKVGSEVSKTSGWTKVKKRVKQLWGREQQPRPPPRHRAAPSESSPLSVPSPRPVTSRAITERGEAQSTQLFSAHSINESLPFFALACSLFAVGADPAKDVDPGNPESAPYLLALGQQALSVWIEGGEQLPARNTEIVAPDEVIKEARADYFRAQSVAVQCYLRKADHSVPGDNCITFTHPNKRQLLLLVSKMSVQLAAWGYEKGLVLVDGNGSAALPRDASARLIRSIGLAEAEQARLRLFWQIVYYERYIASMFGREALIPDSRYLKTALPILVPDYRELAASLLKSTDDRNPEPQSSRLPEPSGPPDTTPATTGKREAEEERLRVERMFFALRAQITHLAATVERRTSGRYTLGDAAKLSTEVQTLLAMAPAELRWACERAVNCTSSAMLANSGSVEGSRTQGSTETVTLSEKARGKQRADDSHLRTKSAKLSHDADDESTHLIGPSQQESEPTESELRRRALSRELSLMAQLLIIRIHSPFAARLGAEEPSALSSCPGALLEASMAIIRIATLFKPPGLTTCPLGAASSTLLHMYPLDQLVFDAVVLCSHLCLGGRIDNPEGRISGRKVKDLGSTELMQTLGIGLDMLEARYGVLKNAEQGSGSSEVTPPSVKLGTIAFLRKQWSLERSTFERPKRRRSLTEGDVGAYPAEPGTPRASHGADGTHVGNSSKREKKSLLPSTTMDERLEGASPESLVATTVETPPKETTPSGAALPSKPVVPRVTREEFSEITKAKCASSGGRGEAAVPIGARARREHAQGGMRKSKHVSRLQTPSQATRARAPRAAKHGGANYGDDERALHVNQLSTSVLQDVIVPQRTHALPIAQTMPQVSPAPPTYGCHGSGTPREASAGPVGHHDQTSDRAIILSSLVPAMPLIGGYATHGHTATAFTSPHYHQPKPTYAPYPQPATAVSMVSQGYPQGQPVDNSSHAYGPGYGSSTGTESYLDKQVLIYTRRSFPPPDLPTTSESSLAHWQGYDTNLPDADSASARVQSWTTNDDANNQWSRAADGRPPHDQ